MDLNRKTLYLLEFRTYFESKEEESRDVKDTINKLPESHKKLAKKYKILFKCGNTLDGEENIGYIDEETMTIHIACPWNYGREFSVLHEIGHIIWKYKTNEKDRNKWKQILKSTKNKQDQNDEELFCMAYANYFAKNKIVIHDHDNWDSFVKSIIKRDN